MADWPKQYLMGANKIRIEAGIGTGGKPYAWEMDGPTFVRCLESGGWVFTEGLGTEPDTSRIEKEAKLQTARDEGFRHGFAFALGAASTAIDRVQYPDGIVVEAARSKDDGVRHGFAFALGLASTAIDEVQYSDEAKARNSAEDHLKEALRLLHSINTA